MRGALRFVLVTVAILTPAGASAQVFGPSGFTIRTQVTIRATPAQVYDALTQVAQWWNPEHTYSGDAKNLTLDARPDGCFCERFPAGGGAEHLRVIHTEPGKRLGLAGALGPLQTMGVAGSMDIRLARASSGTTLALSYAVGGFSEVGFTQLAPAVSGVLTDQLNRLKSFVETGRPTVGGAR